MATAVRAIAETPCGAVTDQVGERPDSTNIRTVSLSLTLCRLFCVADGMDREDSYPDQSCPMGNHHRGTTAGSQWDDSSPSICSQSSDEEVKPMGHSKVELYPPGGDARDYPPAVVNLLPHSGPSAGMGPPVDLGGPYTSK